MSNLETTCSLVSLWRYVPDQQRKAKLNLAGLGDKKISIFLHGDAEDIDYEFNRNYPKLAEGGGYELLRCSDKGSRELVVIDMPPAGYTPQYLQSVVSAAKIYIRPLQKNLDLTYSEDVSSIYVTLHGKINSATNTPEPIAL